MSAFRVVLFDGVCSVCNSSVRFVLKRDSARRVKFASLQSPVAAALLKERGFESYTKELSTVVLLDTDGKVYFKSTAALKVMSQLAFPWSFLGSLLLFVPRFLRDFLYDFVARTRYRFWGSASEKSQCELRPEWRDRFLSSPFVTSKALIQPGTNPQAQPLTDKSKTEKVD